MPNKPNGSIVSVVEDWEGPVCIVDITFADGQVVTLKMGERSYRLWNLLQEACESGRDYAY